MLSTTLLSNQSHFFQTKTTSTSKKNYYIEKDVMIQIIMNED
jgi:hypothetical protein